MRVVHIVYFALRISHSAIMELVNISIIWIQYMALLKLNKAQQNKYFSLEQFLITHPKYFMLRIIRCCILTFLILLLINNFQQYFFVSYAKILKIVFIVLIQIQQMIYYIIYVTRMVMVHSIGKIFDIFYWLCIYCTPKIFCALYNRILYNSLTKGIIQLRLFFLQLFKWLQLFPLDEFLTVHPKQFLIDAQFEI
eukprot:TRINITY_DN3404_c0_g1_i4.p1 TRINITY_DN3404_c0_g1~~TRINITY_DN3404_c0_g1_i4.p1  ORF type:complete len:195 (+),score=-24.00 TRINITY_DN3404_c0_g1_i4:118-702(+)